MRRKLVAGNWKMNGTASKLQLAASVAQSCGDANCSVVICPPATLLDRMSALLSGSAVQTGGQDCHAADSGAHTGDISAPMLADAGASHCIVGHSERRLAHRESNDQVQAKAQAAISAGLVAILCIGETAEERQAGDTLSVIRGQLAECIPPGAHHRQLVIAYEPVWAIGSGQTASDDQIVEVHRFIRQVCGEMGGPDLADNIRLLYGGSVNRANCAHILALDDVDGGLIGGASLKAEDFLAIIGAA